MVSDPLKRCNRCGQEKPVSEFHNSSRTKDGKSYYCKDCENKRNNKYTGTEYKRKWKLKHRFNMNLVDYELTLQQQNYKCAICGCDYYTYKKAANKEFCVDHNHQTGKIRGLLCNSCNRALGLFKDSPENLRKATKYLEER